jgi:hypothetical protein
MGNVIIFVFELGKPLIINRIRLVICINQVIIKREQYNVHKSLIFIYAFILLFFKKKI